MSTNDSGAESSYPAQQAGPSTGLASVGPSQKAGVKTTTRDVRQTGPDTGVHTSPYFSAVTRAASLSQARRFLRDNTPYVINLPKKHLWNSYPLEDQVLTNVREYLSSQRWLTKSGKWNSTKIKKRSFNSGGTDGSETKVFSVLSELFNAILGHLQTNHETSVQRMTHAGTVAPKSTRISTNRPDAFLELASQPEKINWRTLACPFEYKFGSGDSVDNDAKLLWSIVHIMRSDPCRTFSFGSTVYGTEFRIWLLCRAALFTVTPFDWFDDPDSLLRFFILLAMSSKTDLGFDKNIERIDDKDFNLKFTIGGRKYRTLTLLYDIGADAPVGRGSRVFEVKDEETRDVRIIKDCWIEDRHEKEMEHEIVAEIKTAMTDQRFCDYFIDVYGHYKTGASGGLGRVCEILENSTFKADEEFKPRPLVVTPTPKPTYTPTASVANQSHYLEPAPIELAPERPPHPRFRYQVVYSEKGVSLFEVTSFVNVFVHIHRATKALHYLHEAGWVHRDFNPGNIIVVGMKAKISDLEFAKRRATHELKELTKPGDSSSPVAGEVRTGNLRFMAVEVGEGDYLFLPPLKIDSESSSSRLPIPGREEGGGREAGPESHGDPPTSGETIDRVFIYNPLHDYESVWWTAVWFVFHCKPEGVADGVMEKARRTLYENRNTAFANNRFLRIRKLLPPVLQPLAQVLAEMMTILVDAYRSFEESFDGSEMLLVFERLEPRLKDLVGLAQNLVVASPVMRRKLEEVALEVERGRQAMGQEGEAEGQQMAVDDPSVDVETEVLGKRGRTDVPEPGRVLRKRTSKGKVAVK